MPITDMQPAEKVWGNFGCIRIDCRTLCMIHALKNLFLHNLPPNGQKGLKELFKINVF